VPGRRQTWTNKDLAYRKSQGNHEYSVSQGSAFRSAPRFGAKHKS
jgi:hypothetical protein